MNHDPSVAMFWVGAFMVFTPLVVAGVVLFILWRHKRKTGSPPRSASAARPEA